MKNIKLYLIVFSLLIINNNIYSQKSVSQYVNPLIGTSGMGHTFPGACAPFGIVQLSPDTDTIPHNIKGNYVKDVYAYCAGYQYEDPTIVGFSHTHFSGTGHSDLGDLLIMPTVGKIQLNPGTEQNPDLGYRSRYRKDSEISRVGYYEVQLDDYDIRAQLTATPRTGIHKYTYPKTPTAHVILDLVHGIYNYDGKVLWSSLRVENDTLLTGYRITNGWARENYTYFAISFSKPIKDFGYKDVLKPQYNGGWGRFNQYENFPEMAGKQIVSYFSFDNTVNQELTIKVALSAVSTNGALKNLESETANHSFEELLASTESVWEKELSCYEVEGTHNQKTMFYTSLYHTMINPSIYMDVDSKYRGIDGNVYEAKDFCNYTIFSLWDTYRALHPLLNIVKTSRNTDMIKSMIAHQNQSVHKMLPIWSHMANENWCMTGYHAVSILADALVKKLDINREAAFKAMVATSNVPYYSNIKEYKSLGYVPFDENVTAASTTLEYAYDDWCIYQTSKYLSNEEEAEIYAKRSQFYKNVFDLDLGFARPKYADGTFKKDFDILQTHGEGFIEGNSYNFSFHVPHDVNGLIDCLGGHNAFLKKLDNLFAMDLPSVYYEKNEDVTAECLLGGYVHGNEPSHHVPYLYAWTNTPWKTQYWVREIMNKMYKNDIRGLSGNDDCGQMSAWYIFSCMGFYPVCPGSNEYVIGAPYMPYMKLNLENGQTFEIKAPNVNDENRYIKELRLNGKKYTKRFITYQDIINGGVLEFVMSKKPNKSESRFYTKPYSQS